MITGDAQRTRTTIERLCPDLDDLEDCYNRYFSDDIIKCPPGDEVCLSLSHYIMAQQNHIEPRVNEEGKEDGEMAAMLNGDEKRGHSTLTGRLCAPGVNQIRCFDNYVSLWLKAASYREGKRTFGPGKRSSLEEIPQSEYTAPSRHEERDQYFMSLCLSAEEPPACFTKYVKAYRTPEAEGGPVVDVGKLVMFADLLCERAPDKITCYDDVTSKYVDFVKNTEDENDFVEKKEAVQEDKGARRSQSGASRSDELPSRLVNQLRRLKGLPPRAIVNPQYMNPEQKRGLCPSGISKLDCFDRFLGSYAQSSNRGANHFIGR